MVVCSRTTAGRWKSTNFSGQFRMVIGSDFLAAPDGSPHLARFDQESRIVPLGEPVGFFEDGWVRAQASFRFQALAPITSMSLEFWAPPDAQPLSVTMKLSDGSEVTLTALSKYMPDDGNRLSDLVAAISELRHSATFAAPGAIVVLSNVRMGRKHTS